MRKMFAPKIQTSKDEMIVLLTLTQSHYFNLTLLPSYFTLHHQQFITLSKH